MSWYPVDDGATLGTGGSEDGVIVRDDEHGLGARITLEEGGGIAPFSITCGVYGWMVHTRFFSTREEADAAYEAMQADLAAILARIPNVDDPDADANLHAVGEIISDFVDRHP
ncbi:MAG TPA: hypothetical protein VF746_06085 [Longimicrobium sp.]|jgi:hypothetical protein